jgi:Exostosin family
MFQETGFIRFFQNFYPLVEHWSLDDDDHHHPTESSSFLRITSSIPTRDSLFFIPACFYTNASLPIPFNHTMRFDGFNTVPSPDQVEAMLTFQHDQHPFRINKQSFWISTHPLLTLNWANQLTNARTLRTDDAAAHAIGDVIIPVSVELEHCPIHLPMNDDATSNDQIGGGGSSNSTTSTRPKLLFGCGGDHSKRFLRWRGDIFRAVSQLNRTDVFASTGMSGIDYNKGFFQSKFCFVVPGDTISTSQATRAMCGGCVPVFVIDDLRSLPFANMLNYPSFSLLKSIDQLLGPDESSSIAIMDRFVQELEQMLTNGTYEVLRQNLHHARDFFNYHRFDSRSPYAMAVLSIAMDQFKT